MLRLNPNPTFKAPVTIPQPGKDEGVKITVEFKHMPKDDYAAFIAKERDITTARKDEEVILDIAVGWEGVDAEFNSENVREVCRQYHGAGAAIVSTFISELTQYRRGN
jgi:hypothetical protein